MLVIKRVTSDQETTEWRVSDITVRNRLYETEDELVCYGRRMFVTKRATAVQEKVRFGY